jgi:hypothetical protein
MGGHKTKTVGEKTMPPRTRAPLNSAEFNIREIAKQFLLLEDHLADDDKFCKDCVRKHLMMVEALAEEAVTLEPGSKWASTSKELANMSRDMMVAFSKGSGNGARAGLGTKIRLVRKKLVEKVYDPRIKGPRGP